MHTSVVLLLQVALYQRDVDAGEPAGEVHLWWLESVGHREGLTPSLCSIVWRTQSIFKVMISVLHCFQPLLLRKKLEEAGVDCRLAA